LLPYDRLAQLCEDLFGQPLSSGTLVAANERVFSKRYGGCLVCRRASIG